MIETVARATGRPGHYLEGPTCTSNINIYRVPKQVLQSLVFSYSYVTYCKVFQSLILGYFLPKRSYKVLLLLLLH